MIFAILIFCINNHRSIFIIEMISGSLRLILKFNYLNDNVLVLCVNVTRVDETKSQCIINEAFAS